MTRGCLWLRRTILPGLFSLLFLVPAAKSLAQTERRPLPSFGPLPVRAREALANLSLSIEPEPGHALAPGARRIALRADLANIAFINQRDSNQVLFEDNETQYVRLHADWGVGDGWEIGAQLAATARTGGVLDDVIRLWHRYILFGYRDPVQAAFPRGRSLLVLRQPGANEIEEENSAAAFTSLTIQARHSLARNAHGDLAGRLLIKAPLGGSRSRRLYLDNAAWDIGVALDGTQQIGDDWTLHATLGLVRTGTHTVGELHSGKRYLDQIVAGVERRIHTRFALSVQIEDAAFPYRLNLPARPDRRRLTTFGGWYQIGSDRRFYFAVSENIFGLREVSFAPDVQVSAGIIWHHP